MEGAAQQAELGTAVSSAFDQLYGALCGETGKSALDQPSDGGSGGESGALSGAESGAEPAAVVIGSSSDESSRAPQRHQSRSRERGKRRGKQKGNGREKGRRRRRAKRRRGHSPEAVVVHSDDGSDVFDFSSSPRKRRRARPRTDDRADAAAATTASTSASTSTARAPAGFRELVIVDRPPPRKGRAARKEGRPVRYPHVWINEPAALRNADVTLPDWVEDYIQFALTGVLSRRLDPATDPHRHFLAAIHVLSAPRVPGNESVVQLRRHMTWRIAQRVLAEEDAELDEAVHGV